MVGFLEMLIEGMNKLQMSTDIYFKIEQNESIMIQNSCPWCVLGTLPSPENLVREGKYPNIRVPGLRSYG